jgi:chemotaxis-related protein WspD
LKEVSEARPTRSIPHRQNRVAVKLVNIRGELLVCVSLREILGIESSDPGNQRGQRGRMLVAQHGESPVVFPVDEVEGVHRYSTEAILPVPATLAKAATRYSTGVFMLNGRTVGCLDEDLLFYTVNRSLG